MGERLYGGFAGSGQVTTNQVGLYALKNNEAAYVLGSANYGYENFQTDRNYLVGATNQVARVRFGANQFGVYVESGLKLDAGWLHFQPLVGIQYLDLLQNGFDESGGPGALSVASNQAASLRTNFISHSSNQSLPLTSQ